jgi:hypothetical protein
MGWFRMAKTTSTGSDAVAAIEKRAEQPPSDILGQSLTRPRAHYALNSHAGTNTPIYYSSFDSGSRSTQSEQVRDIKCDVLANWLHSKAEERLWTSGKTGQGVFVKKTKGSYACVPANLPADGTGLYPAIVTLNVRVRRMSTIQLSMQ